jgi:hypothetical protein
MSSHVARSFLLWLQVEDEIDDARLVTAEEAQVGGLALNKRDMDLARLQLLTRVGAERLTEEEVHSVAAHLLNTVPQMRTLVHDDPHALATVGALVRASPVLHLKRTSSDPARPSPDSILYRFGRYVRKPATCDPCVYEALSKSTV